MTNPNSGIKVVRFNSEMLVKYANYELNALNYLMKISLQYHGIPVENPSSVDSNEIVAKDGFLSKHTTSKEIVFIWVHKSLV